jgi:hypothetical protein
MKSNPLFLRILSFMLILTVSQVRKAQTNLTIKGEVKSVKNTTRGEVANFDGYYSISNLKKGDVLVFLSTGFQTKEIVVGDKLTINFFFKGIYN